MENRKKIEDILLTDYGCFDDFTVDKLCGLYIVSGSSLLNQCIKEQEEIISSPIRFNGVHINKLKQVFLKNGIEADELGF